MILPGKLAPDFNLKTFQPDGTFSQVNLTDYKGKWLVLFFYPADFTFICPTEITEFSRRHDEFTKLNAEVLGGSTDSVYSHKAWMKELGSLKYPLFSDTKHEVSKNYAVYLEDKGQALRGTFIIDPEGVLKFQLVHDNNVGRSVSEILRTLQALQTGELCPVEWTLGKNTLGRA